MAAASGTARTHRVAVIGGGITGAMAASVLLREQQSPRTKMMIHVDLFDQGRSGVGGRSSTRRTAENGISYQWDHGCQFFRADTERFQKVVQEWITDGIAQEWQGRFIAEGEDADRDFFGLPSLPPFYIGSNGMQSIPQKVLARCDSKMLNIYSGTRVSGMKRNEVNSKWTLLGSNGEPAYHDTAEKVAKKAATPDNILDTDYEAVLLTDVSSSFGGWHRASAGVPETFSARVRERVGARVPLFAAMVAYERDLPVDLDAISFRGNDTIWFASRMRSKGDCCAKSEMDCWTLISTPEYAISQIESTPMQDPKTGAFVPQQKEYLTTVPAPNLLDAFHKALSARLSDDVPETSYLNAQRWGSAMPCHRHLTESSPTRKILSNVPYDSGRAALAPTSRVESDDFDFLMDEELMIFQAGDMVSRRTPGFESAALSGIDAGHRLLALLD